MHCHSKEISEVENRVLLKIHGKMTTLWGFIRPNQFSNSLGNDFLINHSIKSDQKRQMSTNPMGWSPAALPLRGTGS